MPSMMPVNTMMNSGTAPPEKRGPFWRALAGRNSMNNPAYWGNKMGAAANEEGDYSYGVERDAYKRARDWDPEDAYKEYMGGARSAAEDSLGTQLKALAGQAVGGGRLNTGFYDLDQGDVARNIWGDYGRTMSSAALQTAGMKQNQNFGLLEYGAGTRNRYYDLLASNYDRTTAEKNARDAKKGGFLKTLGKIGGGLLGSVAGPIGTAFGASVAGKLFK